jgi:hypothetical protein
MILLTPSSLLLAFCMYFDIFWSTLSPDPTNICQIVSLE